VREREKPNGVYFESKREEEEEEKFNRALFRNKKD